MQSRRHVNPAAGFASARPCVCFPVNHYGMRPLPAHAWVVASYPGRYQPAMRMMYGGQPAGMMLTAQPIQQRQSSGTVPRVSYWQTLSVLGVIIIFFKRLKG